MFYGPLSNLTQVSQAMNRFVTISQRTFELLDEAEQVQPETPVRKPNIKGAIEFKHVTFGYDPYFPVINDVDFNIQPGEMIGLVGHSGAGKTTLVNLLCRFYDPQLGKVEMGGVDVRDLPLVEVRKRITVLFQEPVRYMASVLRNIDPESTGPERAAVEAAVRAAGAEEIVARLPAGYECLLGRWFEGGIDLSVGEWQRLALARALLRQAPVIVLDEPTSAMDPWAEADWLRGFRPFAAGHTAIVITHRLTTARLADQIYVMDQGRVVESGSHEELLAQGGRYARSWRAQGLDLAAPGSAPAEADPGAVPE